MDGAGVVPGATASTRTERDIVRLFRDLDRCPHGRHEGDPCAGWRGPGPHDGGCLGGVSTGNPWLPPGAVLGYTLYGRMITVPLDRALKHDPDMWVMAEVPITGDPS